MGKHRLCTKERPIYVVYNYAFIKHVSDVIVHVPELACLA